MSRDDYNTNCPICGRKGTLSSDYSLIHYKCEFCNKSYQINPKKCGACSQWIADEYEYCAFHKTMDGLK